MSPALAAPRAPGRAELLRQLPEKAVTVLGILVIAVLAVPAAVLLGLIAMVWLLTDWLAKQLSRLCG